MAHTSPTHPDIERLQRIATRMDSAVRIPGLGVRVGWDSIIGLVPGMGDALALAPAGYIVKESYRLGASRSVLARMGTNIGIDFLIGSIPLVGDLFDVGWKANLRNVSLLRNHLEKQRPVGSPTESSRASPARPMSEDAPEDASPAGGRLSSHHPTLKG